MIFFIRFIFTSNVVRFSVLSNLGLHEKISEVYSCLNGIFPVLFSLRGGSGADDRQVG